MVQQLMHEIAEWERKLEMEEASEAATRRKDGTSTPPFEPRTFNEDELLPCHYFDFMYGTSTGGLIATMLGRLRMSVPQCLELYRQVRRYYWTSYFYSFIRTKDEVKIGWR